jgi:hypothetical protein
MAFSGLTIGTNIVKIVDQLGCAILLPEYAIGHTFSMFFVQNAFALLVKIHGRMAVHSQHPFGIQAGQQALRQIGNRQSLNNI